MYTFAGWCRNMPSPFGPFIGLSLGKTNQGVVTPLGTAQWTSDTAWTYLSATDTFFLGVGDTAAVILSSGLVGGPAGPSAQFDGLTLTSSTGIQEHARGTVLLYPDPVVHTLYLANEANNTAFAIRDARGSLVQRGHFDPHGIDVGSLPAGLYLIECDRRVARFLKQ